MELKKCPHCNEEKACVSHKTINWIIDGMEEQRDAWRVFCPICKSRTMDFSREQDAIKNWNGTVYENGYIWVEKNF